MPPIAPNAPIGENERRMLLASKPIPIIPDSSRSRSPTLTRGCASLSIGCRSCPEPRSSSSGCRWVCLCFVVVLKPPRMCAIYPPSHVLNGQYLACELEHMRKPSSGDLDRSLVAARGPGLLPVVMTWLVVRMAERPDEANPCVVSSTATVSTPSYLIDERSLLCRC